MGLLQIIYTSHATIRLDKQALRELVVKANRRNRANGITGMLYWTGNAYLQVLEGDEKAVLPIYADILRDERHDDIRTVVIRPIEGRDFAKWGMGLVEHLSVPRELAHVLDRRDDRVRIWNDAAWPTILNTFRAELAAGHS
jgi:hypothetical protein